MTNKSKHPEYASAPIAVVGMSCIFPKAQDLKSYWRLIRWSEDAIREVPESHWPADDYFDSNPKSPDRVYCRRGAFLEPVDFDPTEFGIPPTALEATDTAQLLGLLAAKSAIDDAGYGAKKEFDRSRTSVILGVTGTLELVIPLGARLGHPHWLRALRQAGVDEAKAAEVMRRISESYVPWQENSFPGLLGNVVAGRIANRLDLKGTNCVVDAACASSLSALHLAMLELSGGRSDMVVTGGVDTLNDIFMFTCFCKTQALSLSGDARPFAANADGTVIGEGVGMLVLKRLQDAERDGDRIYAIIRSVGTSSDGKSQSIYAPRAEGQAEALRNAYRNALVDPSTIQLVEAHGTGTKVGDLVEFESLKQVYTQDNESPKLNWCAVGSVKAQIGHTKAAAGAASLIKTILALHHKVLPATIKVDSPHPGLEIEKSPFYLNTETRPWIAKSDQPRRAAVSSFGFGGSNFHAVLEEYPTGLLGSPAWDGSVELLALSSSSSEDFTEKLSQCRREAERGIREDDLARLAASSRQSFSAKDAYRMAIVIEREADWAAVLAGAEKAVTEKGFSENWSIPNVYFDSSTNPGKTAFLFPGQASQYVGMGRDLACLFPEAQRVLAHAADGFADHGNLIDSIFPIPVFDARVRQEQQTQLTRTEVAQPAIGAVSLAMFDVISRFGLCPDHTAGHSYGELTALCAAGRIDYDTFHRLSRTRGQLMAAGKDDRGTMVAVQGPLAEIQALITEQNFDVVIANRNSHTQGVLSGSKDAVVKASEACNARGWKVRPLQVSGAFHSRLMADAQTHFAQEIAAVSFAPGKTKVTANTTARLYPDSPDKAGRILAEQLTKPVRFSDQIEYLYEEGVRDFVEVGPKAVLTGLVKSILDDKPHRAIALDASAGRRSGIADLARALAQLAVAGHNVNLSKWEKDPPVKKTLRMNVPLLGANYKSKRKEPSPTPYPTARPEIASDDESLMSNNQHQKEHVLSSQRDTRLTADQPQDSSGQPGLEQIFSVVQEGLRAMQTLQEQTAQAHQQFLTGQEQAHKTFQMVMESQQRLFESLTTGRDRPQQDSPLPVNTNQVMHPAAPALEPRELSNPASAQPSESKTAAAPVKPDVKSQATDNSNRLTSVLLQVISELTGYPEEMLDIGMDMEADLGIDSIKRVEILAAMQERLPDSVEIDSSYMGSLRTLRDIVSHMTKSDDSSVLAQQAETSTGQTSASPATENSAAILLEVVSELTGYPLEMLNPEMDMEADLGIDSIKRVEILAACQERMPGVAAVDSSHLGSMRTLDDVLHYLSPSDSAPQPTPPSVPQAGSNERLDETLLQIVSDLTGYPLEMLNMTMDMEADLGIDSIKRVEILAAVQEKIPNLPHVESSHMGSMRTLADIAQHLSNTVDQADTTTAELSHNDAADVHHEQKRVPLKRQVLVAGELPSPEEQPLSIAPGHEVWVVDDGTGLADDLARRFVDLGIAARVVGDEIPVDGEACAPVGGLVHLFPRVQRTRTANDNDTVDQLKGAFALTKELGNDLRNAAAEGGALFATVSRLDGRFGLSGGEYDPLHGGLGGLAKTVAHEWPEVNCRAFDVDSEWKDIAAIGKRLVEEISTAGPIEIGLTKNARVGLHLVEKNAAIGRMPFDHNDVIIVTGGARGVTAEAALALAREVKPTLVLLGRSPEPTAIPAWANGLESEPDIKRAILKNVFGQGKKPTPSELESAFRKHMANVEINANLERMTQAGAKVIYRSIDITDQRAVTAVVGEMRKKHGPIRGLIHGAGVIEDKLILDKDMGLFEKVFDTKVAGLNILLDAIGIEGLKAIVLFSSVSGRFGRQGQVDYAMANEVLNKTAYVQANLRSNCRVVSINWGPWAGGMVTEPLAREFNRMGIDLIPLTEGAMAMLDELRNTDRSDVEVVIGGAFPKATIVDSHRIANAETPPQTTDDETMHVVFNRSVHVDDHAFLNSHIIGGKPVLPVAMMLEWLGHAALHNNPGLQLRGFDDFRVFKGVILEDNHRELEFAAGNARREGSTFYVPLELRSLNADRRTVTHARAVAVLAVALEKAPTPPQVQLPQTHPFTDDLDSIYGSILFHGPAFRGIENIIGFSDDGILATTKPTPRPALWMDAPLRTTWIADPLAVDVALQLGILWGHESLAAPSLPSAGQSFRRYAQFPSSGVKCLLHVTESKPRRITADVAFLDAQNNVIAQMNGFRWTVDKALANAFRTQALGSDSNAE